MLPFEAITISVFYNENSHLRLVWLRIFGETVRYLRNTPQNDPSSGGSIIIHIEAQGSGSHA